MVDRTIISPDDRDWGRAFIAYMTSDANPHTSYLGANMEFVGSHPEKRLSLKPGRGISIITKFSGVQPFLTQRLEDYALGLAFYATDDESTAQLSLNAKWALQSCDYQAFNFRMDGQRVGFMLPGKQIGPIEDRTTGLRVAELSVRVRLEAIGQ